MISDNAILIVCSVVQLGFVLCFWLFTLKRDDFCFVFLISRPYVLSLADFVLYFRVAFYRTLISGSNRSPEEQIANQHFWLYSGHSVGNIGYITVPATLRIVPMVVVV